MADQDWTAPDAVALLGQLQRTPYKFDFFQALRRLECLYVHQPRLGQSLRPADDPVRLAQQPTLIFPPATLADFRPEPGGPARLEVFFFGLFGPHGPLPLHLTEHARDRLRNADDPTLARFLDLFHHRMLSLFYRAWAQARPTVHFDRPGSDRFSVYVGSLFGLGMPSLRDRDPLPDLAKLHYAGLLACPTRHAEGLCAMLADFFKLPVDIEEFVGQWIDLPADCRCALGHSPATGTLGVNSTIGEQVWNCQQKFRVTFGPLKLADYQRLLPGGDSLPRLVALVRNYLGDELQWDVKLILESQQTPALQLGCMGQLGWTDWLDHQAVVRDAEDLLLEAVQPANNV